MNTAKVLRNSCSARLATLNLNSFRITQHQATDASNLIALAGKYEKVADALKTVMPFIRLIARGDASYMRINGLQPPAIIRWSHKAIARVGISHEL